MRRFAGCLAVFLCLLAAVAQAEDPPADASVAAQQQIADFSLSDFRGKAWSLADFQDDELVVVAFLGAECPLVKLYASRLEEIAQKYRQRGVALMGINANQQDSLAKMGHFVRTHQLTFPMLKDPGNRVADLFAAQRTPEVFVLDRQRRVRYQGRIDDQYTYGIQRVQASREYLTGALDELLAGKPVTIPQTEPVGCHIGRVLRPQEDSEITYSRQISRILQKSCVECHRPGEIAPFALTDYEEVVGWAEMIAEVVREQRMPPWHADARHGEFVNDVRLSDQEKRLIYRWVAAGAPQGDPGELPPPREFVEGWRIGQPDQVLYMADEPFQVPATGEVKYQYFMVDPGFTEDKWIQAAECQPDNRSVVHHIIVAVRPPEGNAAAAHGLRSQWLAATAPGARPLQLRDGQAKFVPAGSKLVFQMHYTPNGSPQQDRSSVGFIFADPQKVRKLVATHQAANTRFQIPPGADNHRVEAGYTFQHDSLLLSMFPHMHLRGKSFRYTATYPDGRREILLDVPRYDFNWQNGYELVEPKRMPAGTKLQCVAHFDNSENNLANPDPSATVRWGDQTWEEMMIGYFNVALADQDLTRQPIDHRSRTEQFLEQARAGKLEDSGQLGRLAQKALASEETLAAFMQQLRRICPQLDRVCWTTVDDGKLVIHEVVQDAALSSAVGGRGTSVPADSLRLARYAQGNQSVMHQDLKEVNSPDFRLLSRVFASSLHVPLQADGKPGTINFWSADKRAFPSEAVDFFRSLVEQMEPGDRQ